MRTWIVLVWWLSGCGGVAWNTTVANHPQVRASMLDSVSIGKTTETRFRTQWGAPTQKISEGAQVAYVYRNTTNPPGYWFPQHGDSSAFVVVLFQYGLAVGAYSSDEQGCRATFAPRPPGAGFDNPTTVKPVNCGVPPGADAGRDGGLLATLWPGRRQQTPETDTPGITEDRYEPGAGGKFK